MREPWLQRLRASFQGGEAADIRVRIFRLICALTGGFCLLVVAPLNMFQSMPAVVHIANVSLGLLGVICLWQSYGGRHFVALFLVLVVALLDLAWFWNAGSDGSITHFYYPVLLFIITLFDGGRRWWLAAGLWLNVGLLLLLERLYPAWVTPFQGPDARFADLQTGVFCSFVALGGVGWLILTSYKREQRRVAEIARQLSAREANYRAIFNSTSDALFVHAADGRILDVNEQACALLGAARERMVGRFVGEFSLGEPPYSQAEASARMQLSLQGQPQVFEWRVRRLTGELFWAEVAMRAWEFQGEQRLVASVRDISGRRLAQETLQLNEERLRLAMEASRQGWFELNVRTGETVASPEYIRMLEYEPAEFRSNFQAWIERIHPADRASVLQVYQQCIQSGDLAATEYRQRAKSGGWKWIRSVAKVVARDAANQPLRVLGTHTDVTERKELESQLLHSQRLEAVGTLASGVAHDLNNILTPMLMASGVLCDKLADPDDRKLMAMLDEGGRRGAAIVRQLLAFSRNLAQDRVPLAPRQLLREMAQLVRASFPKEIKVAEVLPDVPGLVQVEPNQLHQVLMNLCVNARDAMPAGGTITLGLERTEVAAMAETQGGPHLVLSVADTGHGMPPEIMARIFDPFFTTKPVGQGTGLGLASAHGIVKAHRGFIRVESQPGRGTVFRVFLPAQDGLVVAPVVAPAPGRPAAPVSPATILVVDDDPSVLLVTNRSLQRQGYRVLLADDGRQALELLQQHREEVGLVITDFSMPEMDGPTLVPHLLALKPGLRIIGVSGLNQEHRARELAVLGFSEVLAKPYELDDLLRAVRRQLPAAADPA